MHSLWVGSGGGIYRALDEPCKAYFPHTFGLKFPHFFRLNITLVSLANWVPWAGKGLPFPFPLDGFLCRCSVSNKNSAFRNRFGFFDSASIQGNGSAASFLAFSDGRHHRCFSRRRRRRLHYDLPLSCAKFEFIYHTSLDSLCAAQVKLSFARFNQIVTILRHNLVN